MSDKPTSDATDPAAPSDTMTRDASGKFVPKSDVPPAPPEEPERAKLLADRLPIHAVAELLDLLTLVETYRNSQTRYLFRPLAKRAGYDIGAIDPDRPDMYTPGELEALISAHCGRPSILEPVR